MTAGGGLPNLLILVDDQHRWDALGCAGLGLRPEQRSWLLSSDNPIVHTPHLDRLAQAGTRFSQAVCNVAPCVPSRHSFITGMRAGQTGVLTNMHYWPRDPLYPTIGTACEALGYETASIGKMHWKPHVAPEEHVPTKRGFAFRASYDGPATDGPCDVVYDDFATDAERAIRQSWSDRFGRGGENRHGYLGEITAIDGNRLPDSWLADQAAAYLRERRHTDKPFCLVVSLDRPHPESVVAQEYADLYDPDEVPLPPKPPARFEEPDSYLRALRDHLEWSEMSEEDLRVSIARYLANVSFVDACLGKVLEALDECGFADNTIVSFTSDHGEMLGERDRCFSKYSTYDSALRVPLLVRWPGVGTPSTVSDAAVELIDLMPTWLDALGVETPRRLPGRSLRPLLEGRSPAQAGWRSASLTELYTPSADGSAPRAQWAVRTGNYKLIERQTGDSALYDLRNDPEEFVNRIDDAALAGVREELRTTLLHRLMTESEDCPAGDPTMVTIADPTAVRPS
ncbi:choline-sulfatase [Streptomyces sp. SceaMP-e96]|uniref:sulfatase family protein n=1 Tax=Streptomyces TaxID=1883 RepID=UPI000823AA3C|nr:MULTISPECIES: sulfatase-like hydrolase/transferase [unclassified Streptomyces]MYT17780.1 sulfatase-like hydrolase/transferase [Streptomyces sp. SID4951]SCK46844.1 choline-sulfatase [Streptomyces sp. SceaMP-e96]